MQSNTELRDFLRSRRARITPEEAGLPPQPGARRVPGLRREEVAQLAGVSVDYYVRPERGRHLNVSESVLDALARDTDFRRWWADHDVFQHGYGYRRLHHPVVGDLILDYESLTVAGDPEQSLGLHTARARLPVRAGPAPAGQLGQRPGAARPPRRRLPHHLTSWLSKSE